MEEKWFISKTACHECGGYGILVGPFDTEKDANDFNSKFGNYTDEMNCGFCATVNIIKNELPEKLKIQPIRSR